MSLNKVPFRLHYMLKHFVNVIKEGTHSFSRYFIPYSFQFFLQSFSIVGWSKTGLTLKNCPPKIVISVDIYWRSRPFVYSDEAWRIAFATLLCYTNCMPRFSVLLKCSLFITINGIALSLMCIFWNVLYVHFLVDLYTFNTKTRGDLPPSQMDSQIITDDCLWVLGEF